MKTHSLKLNIDFCDDVYSGRKSFEIRNNDRGFQRGDTIQFEPIKVADAFFRPMHQITECMFEIEYVLGGWGLKEGYVVLGIKKVS
jgi:ASC-1-like (ASCH) protein